MNIANPVYDSVFKYLLDDNRVAKIFISAIIGEEITDLHFATTEAKVKLQLGETPEKTIGIPNFITVLRIDFPPAFASKTAVPVWYSSKSKKQNYPQTSCVFADTWGTITSAKATPYPRETNKVHCPYLPSTSWVMPCSTTKYP
jgi:hypothetical protein